MATSRAFYELDMQWVGISLQAAGQETLMTSKVSDTLLAQENHITQNMNSPSQDDLTPMAK